MAWLDVFVGRICFNRFMTTDASFSKIISFIDANPIATIGTINSDGTPHGAIVYMCADNDHSLYFITKSETTKYRNLLERPQVCVTIVNQKANSMLQANGQAFVVNEPYIIDTVFKQITRAHGFADEWLPPIAKLRAGHYVMVGVRLQSARLAEFKGARIGSEHIFTSARHND